MNNKDSDIFELTSSRKSYSKDNFFLDEDSVISTKPFNDKKRRLNDYDANLLQDGAYKDIDDELFVLEYKISKTENELKDLNIQINAAKEIGDTERANNLADCMYAAKTNYESLLSEYNEKTLSARIANPFNGMIKNIIKKSLQVMENKLVVFRDSIINLLPKKLAYFIKIKKSLILLENINKSVDELVTLKAPYGEDFDKYSRLSKYITKANSIQSEISGYIKK